MKVRLVIRLPVAGHKERLDVLRWLLPAIVDLRRRAPFDFSVSVEDDERNGGSVEL